MALKRFENSNPGKASQLIVSQIRRAVDTGELKVGDKLPPERDLIEQFGYSRSVVREALRTLEAEGLIRLMAGRNGGAQIGEPDPSNFVAGITTLLKLNNASIHEVHETLRFLEPAIVELAVDACDDRDIAALQQSIDVMLADSRDKSLVRLHANRFHVILARASKNQMMILFSTLARQVMVRLEYQGIGERPQVVAAEHQKIVDALAAREKDAARSAVLDHLETCECALKSSTYGFTIRDDPEADSLARQLSEPA